MYKSFFYILLILSVVVTLGFCITKPKMHTAMFIYDSDYKIVETSNVTTKQKVEKPAEKVYTPQKQEVKTQTVQVVQPKRIKQEPVVVQKVVQKMPEQKNSVTSEKVIVQPKVETVKTVEQPKIINTVQTEQVQPQIKTTTQEEIEWNKWRSNIQNQIMKDVKLPILPQGTVFKFSFDVDKYGRVTNVQTWALPSAYTPYAIQHIAPVIRNYQGRAILDFPSGSNRTNTTVTGQWKISNNLKYSTSSNFHDIETVKRTNE